ncbi:hypothetical protein BH09VER1_BH09VER1_31720 [soil metagenome]
MNVLAPLAALLLPLSLSACTDFDTGVDHSNGLSPADAFIGKVSPGSENDSRFNHGIGATPTY